MALNDFSLVSSSDSEVFEIEDSELEVEGSPKLDRSSKVDVEETHRHVDEPLAEAECRASVI